MYERFGLSGHNGIDYRAPIGTPVYAPHDGVVKERHLDENGYGNYLKIESDTEGSVLAHLQKFAVNVNKPVKEGDLVGYANNTGFSTASHLHWGYYRLPRDRSNGYNGYINQIPLMEEKQDWLRTMYLERGIDITKPEGEVRGSIQTIFDNAKKYKELEKKNKELEKENVGLSKELAGVEKEFQLISKSRDEDRKAVEEANRETNHVKKDLEATQRRLASFENKDVVIVDKEEYTRITSLGLARYPTRKVLLESLRRLVRAVTRRKR